MTHRTPRYIYNRIRVYWYEKQHPEVPWLSARAVELLDTLLPGNDLGLEWGSGRSTAWFAQRTRHLTSVEHNASWHESVKKACGEKKLTNIEHLLRPLEDDESKKAYVSVCDRFGDKTLGFALVDGSDMRAECAIAAVPKMAPGGLLVVDNSHMYIDYPTHSPTARYGLGHVDEGWKKYMELVKEWRLIWTTSGVSDTAIWIRPA